MRFDGWRGGKVESVLRYGAALAAALALLAGVEALQGLLGNVVLSVAVAGVAVLSLGLGAGPGLLATTVVGLGTWYFLQPTHGSFFLQSGREAARLAGYFVASFTVVGTIGLLHHARRRLRASLDALREASRQLVEADQRKTQFLAVLSHELRNPLTPIKNGIHILEHAAPGGEQARRALRMIDRQVQHMARLIDDLLDVTRISRGKINLKSERVDLAMLARGAAEDQREVFARSGIVLEVEGTTGPLWVDGDPTRLAQLIGNLLNNAAKFTPPGGTTVLTIGAGAPGEALIQVRDDGSGMSPETLASIFQPFVQAAQTLDRTRGGLGLGLALVKGLTELHGVNVTARSDGEGKGSEFTVTLPLAGAREPATDAGDAPGVSAPAPASAAAASD